MFKIVRGVDNLAIEEDCGWAVPKDTWTNPKKNEEIAPPFEIDR